MSKETLNRRTTIEAAFRACRDVFMEVSTVLMNLLDLLVHCLWISRLTLRERLLR